MTSYLALAFLIYGRTKEGTISHRAGEQGSWSPVGNKAEVEKLVIWMRTNLNCNYQGTNKWNYKTNTQI